MGVRGENLENSEAAISWMGKTEAGGRLGKESGVPNWPVKPAMYLVSKWGCGAGQGQIQRTRFSPSVHSPSHLYTCPPTHQPLHLLIHSLLIHPFVHPSVHPPIHQPPHLSIHHPTFTEYLRAQSLSLDPGIGTGICRE